MHKSFSILFVLLAFNCCLAMGFDTTAFHKMTEKARLIQTQSPDSAFYIARKLLKTARRYQYAKGQADANLRMGSLFMQEGRFDSAQYHLKRAINIRNSMSDKKGVAHASLLLGYIKRESGQPDSCLHYYLNSVRSFEEIGDSIGLIDAYLQLAHVYLDYDQVKKAKSYYFKSLLFSEHIDSKSKLMNSQSGLGKFYFETEQFDSSLYFYSKANEGYIAANNWVNVATSYNNMASCLINMKQYPLAFQYYNKVIETYRDLKMDFELSITYYNLGWVYADNKSYDTSLYYFEKSKMVADIQGDIEHAADCYESIAEVYSLMGEYSLAYKNHLIFATLRDSLLNKQKVKSIAEMQTIYETEKKEQEINLLNALTKTQKAESNVIMAVGAILVLVFLLLLLYYFQRNRIANKNEEIAKQKLESTLDEHELKTYNAVIEGQEEERIRIATDLHDRLGSMLSTVKLLFGALEEKIDRKHEKNQNQYDKANNLLDEACVEVRRISHNLGSGMVANFGLGRAVEELCESVDESGQIRCKAIIFGMEKSLQLKVEVAVYRIIQEIVNNAIKHAKAKSITVQINRVDQELSLMVEDDGIGFNYHEKQNSDGMGLNNLKKRTEELNGSLHVDSYLGKGTTVIIEIPINM